MKRRNMDWTEVQGEDRGALKLYAISTCGWCRKTKALLDELGVEYQYRYVDMLSGDEREEVIEEVARWNPARSFPTIVLDGEKAIVGYKADKIREALGYGE